jgi:hypothetical protein
MKHEPTMERYILTPREGYVRPLTDMEREMINLDHSVAHLMNFWHDGIMTEEEVRRVLGARGLA